MPGRVPYDPWRMATGAFVSWLPFSGRSQGFIDALELQPVYSSYLRERDIISAPLKYGPQFVHTLRQLYRERPEAVFVMNPPVFAVAAVYLYCVQTGAKYVMDCHSGVFESRKWRWSLPLQRWFGRRAACVIVTNPIHRATVDRWPARSMIVGDPPPRLPVGIGQARPAGTATDRERFVFVIATFGPEEAIPEVLEAARALPHVSFRISGDTRRAPRRWLDNAPPNVRFTGYLPLQAFWQHVQDASAILTLTKQENTILQGGWEAMFVGRPLITSDTAALRGYFVQGARFVDNSVAGIAAGIEDVLANHDEIEAEMERLRHDKYLIWRRQREELEALLGVDFATPAIAAGR